MAQEVRNDGNVWRQQEGRNGWQWSSTHGWQWDEWGESTPEPESSTHGWQWDELGESTPLGTRGH